MRDHKITICSSSISKASTLISDLRRILMRKRSSLDRRNMLPTLPEESFLNVSSLQIDFMYSSWLISSSSCISLQPKVETNEYTYIYLRQNMRKILEKWPESQGTIIFPFKFSNGSRWKMFDVLGRVSNPVFLSGFDVLRCYLPCKHFQVTLSISLSTPPDIKSHLSPHLSVYAPSPRRKESQKSSIRNWHQNPQRFQTLDQ